MNTSRFIFCKLRPDLGRLACAAAMAVAAQILPMPAGAATTGNADQTPAHPPQAQQLMPPASPNRGLIQPPAGIDPGIKEPAPDAQKFPMPVLRPPGTPGGNPQVVPK